MTPLDADVAAEVEKLLGCGIRATLWTSGRVAPVWAVELADGHRFVVKVRTAAPGMLEQLVISTRVQGDLHDRGLPVPHPVAVPFALDQRLVTIESLLNFSESVVTQAQMAEASLRMLLRILSLGRSMAAPSRIGTLAAWCDSDVESRGGRLWPEPHDVALFGPSFEGADRDIEDLATRSAKALSSAWREPGRVLAHDDWEAQNLRFTEDLHRDAVVSAIFDADAFTWLPEVVVAGTSAVQHTAGFSSQTTAPSLAELDAWVNEFEVSLGGRDVSWRRLAHAAAGWTLAYNARCDQAMSSDGPGTYRASCRELGDRLIAWINC